jgi:hypothetical protein
MMHALKQDKSFGPNTCNIEDDRTTESPSPKERTFHHGFSKPIAVFSTNDTSAAMFAVPYLYTRTTPPLTGALLDLEPLGAEGSESRM